MADSTIPTFTATPNTQEQQVKTDDAATTTTVTVQQGTVPSTGGTTQQAAELENTSLKGDVYSGEDAQKKAAVAGALADDAFVPSTPQEKLDKMSKTKKADQQKADKAELASENPVIRQYMHANNFTDYKQGLATMTADAHDPDYKLTSDGKTYSLKELKGQEGHFQFVVESPHVAIPEADQKRPASAPSAAKAEEAVAGGKTVLSNLSPTAAKPEVTAPAGGTATPAEPAHVKVYGQTRLDGTVGNYTLHREVPASSAPGTVALEPTDAEKHSAFQAAAYETAQKLGIGHFDDTGNFTLTVATEAYVRDVLKANEGSPEKGIEFVNGDYLAKYPALKPVAANGSAAPADPNPTDAPARLARIGAYQDPKSYMFYRGYGKAYDPAQAHTEGSPESKFDADYTRLYGEHPDPKQMWGVAMGIKDDGTRINPGNDYRDAVLQNPSKVEGPALFGKGDPSSDKPSKEGVKSLKETYGDNMDKVHAKANATLKPYDDHIATLQDERRGLSDQMQTLRDAPPSSDPTTEKTRLDAIRATGDALDAKDQLIAAAQAERDHLYGHIDETIRHNAKGLKDLIGYDATPQEIHDAKEAKKKENPGPGRKVAEGADKTAGKVLEYASKAGTLGTTIEGLITSVAARGDKLETARMARLTQRDVEAKNQADQAFQYWQVKDKDYQATLTAQAKVWEDRRNGLDKGSLKSRLAEAREKSTELFRGDKDRQAMNSPRQQQGAPENDDLRAAQEADKLRKERENADRYS